MAPLVDLTLDGRPMRIVDPATYPYAQNCFDDREPIAELWERFGAGRTVVDVGASFGAYTLSALARGARTIALEPSDDGWPVLCANVAANFGKDALLYPDLYCQQGPGYFLRRAIAWGPSEYPRELADEVFVKHYPTDLSEVKRPGYWSLDGLLRFEDRVDCIKIDVEGAELGVLRGAEWVLRHFKPMLLIEDHETAAEPEHPICRYCRSVKSRDGMHELLTGLGYTLRELKWGSNGERVYLVAEVSR